MQPNKATVPQPNDHARSRHASSPRSFGRSSRRLRGLLGGSVGLSAFAAVLLFAAPLTLAHGTVTFAAPFNGFHQSPSTYTSSSGCASLQLTTAPTWTSTNGTYQVANSVRAGKCSYGFAEAYSSISLTSPKFSTPYAGYGYVYATISSAFSARAVLHLAPPVNGSYTYAYSEVALTAAIYIYDVSPNNGSLFGYATDTMVSQYFDTTGSFALTTGWVTSYMYADGTFVAGHHYQVQFDISATVYASTYGVGSSASASLNLGGTNGLVVSSIVAT